MQQATDPHYNDEYAGKGLGMAPIGHVVTVVGGSKFTIDIDAEITLLQNYTLPQVKPNILDNIEAYFLSLRQDWDKADDLNNYSLKVIVARVRSAILNTTGVENILSCKLNNVEGDITLTEDSTLQQVPVTGEITINEQS